MALFDSAPAYVLKPRVGFIVVSFALLAAGLVMAYSASSITGLTSQTGSASTYLFSQLKYAAIGGAFGLAIWKIVPFETWESNFTWIVWGLCVVAIIATAIFGVSHGGAKRWIIIPFVNQEIQPSEFCKIGFGLITCKLFNDYRLGQFELPKFVLLLLLVVLLPLGMLYVFQSDLGTTVICGICAAGAAYYFDVDIKVIIAIVIIAMLCVFLASTVVGYRSERFVYLDPWNDGEDGYGSGYQTVHSLFALADGGFFGVGLGNSREKFLYLPERNTDYVFAVVCEELGMFGALIIILMFVLLLYFGLHVGESCSSPFGRALASCLSTMLVFQAFLNIGCAISLFPMTGKPLPFFSTGGSSMISTMIVLGFVLAASRAAGREAPEAEYARRRENLRVSMHAGASGRKER